MPPLHPKDHRISLERARDMVKGHSKLRTPKLPRCMAFHRDVIDEILAQPGCVGLRMYPAHDGEGATTMVLLGVDKAGNDMTQGVIAEEQMPCPPFCSDQMALDE